MENKVAFYIDLKEIFSGKYFNQKVRVLGSIESINSINNHIILINNNQKIECIVPEKFQNLIFLNNYIQVIGIVENVYFYF